MGPREARTASAPAMSAVIQRRVPCRPAAAAALLLLLTLPQAALSQAATPWAPPASKNDWASRTIYQVLIDRFSRGGGDDGLCTEFNGYCGGTWKGLTEHILPYIKDMGFDAVWFTPINAQTDGPTWQYRDGSYHGYWPRDLWSINERFGSKEDLRGMIDALHAADMWAMLDVVPNHSGFGDTSSIAVFNSSEYYHTCDGCQLGCGYSNQNDQQIRRCRLSNLPDLAQDVPYVAAKLLEWHTAAYSTWQIDGYRVDAARHVEVEWLDALRRNISIFTIGEFASPLDVIQSRLAAGALDSSLNFPLQAALLDAFKEGDMASLVSAIQAIRSVFGPNSTQPGVLPLLGNFMENHDQERFLCDVDDIRPYENAHAYLLFAEGIPIVYYGAEIGMKGMRDPLWTHLRLPPFSASASKLPRDFEMYKLIKILVGVRKARKVWAADMNLLTVTSADGEADDVAEHFLAFERAGVVVIINNLGRSYSARLRGRVTLTVTGLPVAVRGATLSNVLFPAGRRWPGTSNVAVDTLAIGTDGAASFVVDPARWPQIYLAAGATGFPTLQMEPYVPYDPSHSGLGPDGAVLVVFWSLSGVVAILAHLALRGWFKRGGKEPPPDIFAPLTPRVPLLYRWWDALQMRLGMRRRRGPRPRAPHAQSRDEEEGNGVFGGVGAADTRRKRSRAGRSGEGASPFLEHGSSSSNGFVREPSDGVGNVRVVLAGPRGSTSGSGGLAIEVATSGTARSVSTGAEIQLPAVRDTPAVVAPAPAPSHAHKRSLFEGEAGLAAGWAVVQEGISDHADMSMSLMAMASAPRPGSPPATAVAAARIRSSPGAVQSALVPLQVSDAGGAAAGLPVMLPEPGHSPGSDATTLGASGLPPRPQTDSPRRLMSLPSRRQIIANNLLLSGGASVPMSPGGALMTPASLGPLRSAVGPGPASLRWSWHPLQQPTPRGGLNMAMVPDSAVSVSAPHLQPSRLAPHRSGPEAVSVASVLAPLLESPDDGAVEAPLSTGGPRQALPAPLVIPTSPHAAAAPRHAALASSAPRSSPNARNGLPLVAADEVAAQVSDDMVLHVAMEYAIPHLDMNTQFMYGGLGKVVEIFLREWPGRIGLCAPLYADAYANHETDTAPKFLPPGENEPTMRFSVTISRRLIPVELFILEHENVAYYLIQADIFKHRKRATIYTFEEEAEMLTWVSVMSQATSVVISTFGVRRVQYHDWHGTLSLMYLPPEVRPEVLLVLHNAHYDGTFPVPNRMRKVYVYAMFDLDIGIWPSFLEHKGAVDMLHGVLRWIKLYQRGTGVVAVSPKYAELIHHKLDVLWQLKARQVVGILNALPFSNCLAAEYDSGKRSLDDIIAYKAECKARFQAQFGLHVSDKVTLSQPFCGPQLVVFLGRMTHQKGCDTIAQAADFFLKQCPDCQLVMVGPVGDITGAHAQEMMKAVAAKHPGRVFCRGEHFGGADKELLLDAADFCLLPSRFEPCGLVDIEFGWNGAIMIGHQTGGLGKMPGVYYTVQSSARSHLAAQLGAAVVRALALGPEQRRRLLQEALEKRFPTAEMMRKYQEQWDLVHAACEVEAAEAAELQERAAAQAGHEFFSQLWRKHNLQDVATKERAALLDRGRVLRSIRDLTGWALGRHDISYMLLLVMEAFCRFPSYMVNGFFVHVYLGYTTITSCQAQWDASWDVFPDLMNALAFRVLLSYGLYTIAAPCWTLIAMRVRPTIYVTALVWLVLASALMSHACMYWTVVINPTIIFTSIVSPMGLPLLSLNFLGKDLEVSETGFKYMTVVELIVDLGMLVAALLAAKSRTNLAFMAMNGFTVLVAALYVAWFMAPDMLHPAYRHVRLVFKKQWKLIGRISSFWLTSIVMVCENVALVLTAYSTLLSWNLTYLMALIAAQFGARAVSLFTTYGLLQLRFSQLHIQDLIMGIAALPGFAVAKQIAVTESRGFSGVLATVTIVEFVYGARNQLVGLLAFQTLPSREVVAVWQLTTMVVSTLVPTLVLALGYTTRTNYANETNLLAGVIVCECVRLLAMGGLYLVHGRENLSTL